MEARLASIFIYPVKSCRRVETRTATVEPWGLAGDRRWLVTDPDGVLRTQRELPRMALIRTGYGPDGRLLLSAPGLPDLEVPAPRRTAGADTVEVEVWRFRGPAAWAGSEADAWLSRSLEQPSRLAYMDDTSVRAVNPDYGRDEDRVSFADGYPLLLAAGASLDALNAEIEAMGGEGVPMTRFRPNVVVEGTEPWAELGWKRVRIGGQEFRVAKPCDRCVMTTVDPERGAFAGQQPLKALRKHHRVGKLVLFGMNLIPDTVGPLTVGDPFTVLA
jgi:uncharacterized protein YcbX